MDYNVQPLTILLNRLPSGRICEKNISNHHFTEIKTLKNTVRSPIRNVLNQRPHVAINKTHQCLSSDELCSRSPSTLSGRFRNTALTPQLPIISLNKWPSENHYCGHRLQSAIIVNKENSFEISKPNKLISLL